MATYWAISLTRRLEISHWVLTVLFTSMQRTLNTALSFKGQSNNGPEEKWKDKMGLNEQKDT